MAEPKKETCEECACFLPYFVVAQERGIPESIIKDPTNPNKCKMFCARNFRETKKENPICSKSEFLKRDGSGLTWQELDEQKEKREEKKLKNRTLLISIIALVISIISLVIGVLSHFYPFLFFENTKNL